MSLLLLFDDSGTVIGTATVTEADDTPGASAKAAIAASAGLAEGADSLSAGGAVLARGSLSRTEASDALAAQASVLIQAFAPMAGAGDVLAALGVVGLTGQAAIIEADDGSAAFAAVSVVAALAAVEADDGLTGETFQGRVPLAYRKGGDDDWRRHEWERLWKQDLRRIIDEAWRIADGEIDPHTRETIPPPDLSAVHKALSLMAQRRAGERMTAVMADQERKAEDEAVSLLLLAA